MHSAVFISCRWQQFLIDNFVGYDTILMNSLLSAYGRGMVASFDSAVIVCVRDLVSGIYIELFL